MAVYLVNLPKCRCGRAATKALECSGTDRRGVACDRCAPRLGRELAERLGVEFYG